MINSIGNAGSFGNQHSENSVLTAIGKAVTPVFEPLGIEPKNWPATIGIFTGVLAKEAVVGTLDAIYSRLAAEDAGEDATKKVFNLWTALGDAVATVPANLAAISERILDPLGLDIGDIDDAATAAKEQEVSSGLFGAMVTRFDGQIGAFAFLLFILLYSPCAATIAAIARETNGAWAGFVVAWTTGVAYITAGTFYQLATYSRHPQSSIAWSLSLVTVLVVTLIGLRLWARRGDNAEPLTEGAR
jgi:ferrous iron transport protein B